MGLPSQPAQPDYLNTVALARTALEPEAVMALAKALEREAGRRRTVRFGPRPLDVDLLLWDDLVLDRPELTLPHPRLRERRFVLEPLTEIAPDLRVPPDGVRVADLLAALPPGQDVVRITPWDRLSSSQISLCRHKESLSPRE